MPQVDLPELLLEVHPRTGSLSEFIHASGGESRMDDAELQKADLYAAIRTNLRLFADVPEEDILLCVVETNSENWWAAGRTVNPLTGYDERMDHVFSDTAATN
ncbi:hypothetical protein [Saccharopolyspora phatthalungensis]|uniref:Tautomerase enzyme n=1 Tax=Saccharopolyspora phatthalungensis TaxID=664693 RepID=A0A840QDX9_9PSEU|nr:hypothetical protein [Saccharopolyspora phatthalungensis]MBB5158217.1 hypothetical protein [Saccharopolyspora phatthalungensis]